MVSEKYTVLNVTHLAYKVMIDVLQWNLSILDHWDSIKCQSWLKELPSFQGDFCLINVTFISTRYATVRKTPRS